jgi:hypothetical protein
VSRSPILGGVSGSGSDPRDPDDAATALAAQVLLAQYSNFEQTFRWNEEMGERRVNLVLTLMTVAAGATGLILGAVEVPVASRLRGAGIVASGLLFLGLVTLARLVRRNVATDEYKRAMDLTRDRLVELSRPHLAGYDPFPEGAKTRLKLKRLLGLTLLMSATNGVFAVAAVLLFARPATSVSSLALALLVLTFAVAVQLWLAAVLEQRLRSEVRLPKRGKHVVGER